MTTVLCKTLLSLYAHLPVVNKLTEKDIEDGLLRMKFFVPVMLDKNHPVEGVFRKIFLYSFFLSILPFSVYFWYVTQVSGGGLTLQAFFAPSFVGLGVATYFSPSLHAMYQRFTEKGKESLEYTYLDTGIPFAIVTFCFFLILITKIDNIQATHPHELLYQYVFLITVSNYLFNVWTFYVNLAFTRINMFHPKWIWAFWIFLVLFLIYKNFVE